MPDINEVSWAVGNQQAWLRMLGLCLSELGVQGNPEAGKAQWVVERAETVVALRQICADFGDNDWPDDLHIADVLDNHLGQHLHAKE